MSEKIKGVFALTTATFIGGAIMPSLIRTGVESIDPMLFTFFRTGLSALIFLLIAKREILDLIKKDKQLFSKFALLGATLGGNLLLFAKGVSHTTLIVSQLMYTILPITTGIVGFFWLKEKMPLQKILGALIAIVGVTLLIISSQSSTQRLSLGSLYGNLLILAAVMSYTLYFILSKKHSQHYQPMIMSAFSTIGAAVLSLPFAVFSTLRMDFAQVSLSSWLSTLAIGFVSTLFYFLVQYGIKRLSTVTGATITQLSPEFAAIAGILFYHEKISVILIVSLLLVSGGAFLSIQTEKTSFWQKILSKIES